MAALSDLLPLAVVRLDVPVPDWRASIRVAGGLLVETGAITATYTTEMIGNVVENGPYIVIAPGFALAHARPSPAALRTALSWVRLARPVEFGHESNDPVSLVVALAARDQGAHTAALAALARLLANPDISRALREAPDPASLRALLAAPEVRSPAESTEVPVVHRILTVCGNGLGTSLFLKTTLERVLAQWGWARHVTVEATDTISARGKAAEAVAILTSREIAGTLGEMDVPVVAVEDFTSAREVDRVLRDIYDV
ncbi:PTS sugar transporter subunit IIA [Streptomyces yunnanensis]|uniref:Ascorbate-specific PTS system EIIA component n=1 Tax=Streptomyces yunnanensis TaxID=156453 RepID=A0A9X8R096_9ACTN|nr:PTS sugar transporter subunit IIA [Streptomyces yunnanensis]SHN32120.1 PTS system IIA component, L-Asc family /PTS system IIB component, L-Asc family [Streptomyces yunnanensis]